MIICTPLCLCEIHEGLSIIAESCFCYSSMVSTVAAEYESLYKCEALSITTTRSQFPLPSYFIGGQPVQWTNLVKYLGIHINKLQWYAQCQIVAAKATRILNVLGHTMFGYN